MALSKLEYRAKRKVRIRKKILGTAERPRLSVYRSLRFIYAQLIDDLNKRTLASASSLKKGSGKGGNKVAAEEVGMLLAEKAKSLKISKVAFDRNGFLYHGQVKSLADAARKGGLEF